MKNYNIVTIVLAVICIIILVPLGIAFLLSFNFINTDTSNEWIGFWGGYIGAIVGGLITLYVMHTTLNENKVEIERQREFDLRLSEIENKRMLYKELIKEISEFISLIPYYTLASQSYLRELINNEHSDKLQMHSVEAGNKIDSYLILITTKLHNEEETKEEISALHMELIEIRKVLGCFNVGEYDAFSEKQLQINSAKEQLKTMRVNQPQIQNHLDELESAMKLLYKNHVFLRQSMGI